MDLDAVLAVPNERHPELALRWDLNSLGPSIHAPEMQLHGPRDALKHHHQVGVVEIRIASAVVHTDQHIVCLHALLRSLATLNDIVGYVVLGAVGIHHSAQPEAHGAACKDDRVVVLRVHHLPRLHHSIRTTSHAIAERKCGQRRL